MMDEIIDRLARGCAEAIITVQPYDPEDGQWWVCVGRSVTQSGDAHLYGNKADAEYDAAIYRDNAAPFIADALRGFARTPPWPSPVSEERLAQIDDRCEDLLDSMDQYSSESHVGCLLRDQRTHVAHLTHLVRAMSAESEGLIYGTGFDAGRRAGAEEQRSADTAAALSVPRPMIADWDEARRVIARAVIENPLVTDVRDGAG